MLKFENYPPTQEADVNITVGAAKMLEDASRYYRTGDLYDYGVCIGNTLAASVESMDSPKTKGLINNLGGHALSQAHAVILEANEVLGAENYLTFTRGFAQGSLLPSRASDQEPFVTSTNSTLFSAKR